jgi:hypothetical protein
MRHALLPAIACILAFAITPSAAAEGSSGALMLTQRSMEQQTTRPPPTPQVQVVPRGATTGRTMSIRAGRDMSGICSSCSAICQTIVLFGSDYYTNQNLGGGMSPSQCVDAAAAACGAAYSTYLSQANCKM